MPFDIGHLGDSGRGARRLLALAAYLETVADGAYDQRAWRRRAPDGSWTMCALGHGATALPDLIGLRWRSEEGAELVRLDGSGVTEDPITLAAEAFEISFAEAMALFGVGVHTTRLLGARRPADVRPKAIAAALRAVALAKLPADPEPAVLEAAI